MNAGVRAVRVCCLGLWVVALVGQSGCGTSTVSLRPEPRSFTPKDYQEVYERWTRADDDFAFGRLSDVLHVTATFESWEFRWAYVVRYADDYALATEERAAILRATLADSEEHHRFFVTLIGNDYRDSDLTSDRAVWRVILVDEEGRQTVPVEVEKVERPDSSVEQYFPSISAFRHAYRIAFPAQRPDGAWTIGRGASHVVLRFTGAEGTVDLRWDFER
jgi:hypothetical protein